VVFGHGNCCRMLKSQFGVPCSRPLSHPSRSCSSCMFPVQWSPKAYFSVWFAHKQIALLPLIQLQIIRNNLESIRIYSNNNQRMEGGKNLWSTIDALVACSIPPPDWKKNYDRSIRIMRWEDWITLQKVHITLLCVYRNWLPGGGGTRSRPVISWRIATSKLPASITVRMASRASIQEEHIAANLSLPPTLTCRMSN
jgi:hypothetical protein